MSEIDRVIVEESSKTFSEVFAEEAARAAAEVAVAGIVITSVVGLAYLLAPRDRD